MKDELDRVREFLNDSSWLSEQAHISEVTVEAIKAVLADRDRMYSAIKRIHNESSDPRAADLALHVLAQSAK